ncbi:MAG: superoxide dismutase family protein [Pseudomonadota bacterium]
MKLNAKTSLFTAAFAVTLGLNIQSVGAEASMATASVALENLAGVTVGSGALTQTPHGVLVHVKVRDLPPGAKGIHLHSVADCAADTAFKSSKGHHGEGEGDHGLLNARGPGKGDLGNIYIGADGVGELQFFKAGVFLTEGDLPLLDSDGTAIVIHANEDDQVSQPIGGAGARIVCGLVEIN